MLYQRLSPTSNAIVDKIVPPDSGDISSSGTLEPGSYSIDLGSQAGPVTQSFNNTFTFALDVHE